MTDGSSEGYKYSRFRWRAAAVAARRCKKLHARACWAPRGALPLSFSVISIILSGTGPPDLPLTARADDWSFCWPFFRTFSLPFALPRYRVSPLALPPQYVADLAVATIGHPTVPARQDTFKLHTPHFFMKIIYFILFCDFSSDLSPFALKTIRPRKQEQLPCNAPAIVCFVHSRTPSAAVMPNRAQGALPFILSDCIWRSPQSPSARVYRPLMLPPAGLLSPPLIRSTFAEITTTDAIFAFPSSIYCIQYTFA